MQFCYVMIHQNFQLKLIFSLYLLVLFCLFELLLDKYLVVVIIGIVMPILLLVHLSFSCIP